MKITAYSFLMAFLWSDSFIILSLAAMKWNRFIRHSVLPLALFLFASICRLVVVGEFQFSHVIRVGEAYEKILCFFAYLTSGHKLFGTELYVGTVLIAAWVIVAVVALVVYLLMLLRSIRQIKRITAVEDLVSEELLSSLLCGRKYMRSVPVFRTAETNSPFCSGIFKQKIYLPETEFTRDELKGILIHEWSHACHHDVLVRVLINMICILFWWNPLIYLLKTNMYHTMELRCDREVQRMLTDDECVTYMETIVKISELASKNKLAVTAKASLISTADKRLVQRFEVMAINDENKARTRIAGVLFVTVMLVLLAVSYMFVIQPYVGYATPGEDYIINEMTEDEYSLNGAQVIKESVYIVDNEDGTYSLFCDGEFVSITEDLSIFKQRGISIIQGD